MVIDYYLILYILIGATLLIAAASTIIWYWATPVAIWFRFLERRYGRMKSGWITLRNGLAHVLHRSPEDTTDVTTLLMLHGLGADADHWCLLTAELPDHVQILAPDLPGFGDSELPQHAMHNPQAYAGWLIDLLDELGIQQCHVIGNSMGGYVAANLARDYPERVLSLCLLAPAGLHDAPLSEVFETVQAGNANPLIIRTMNDQKRLYRLTTHRRLWLPGVMHRWFARRAKDQAPHIQLCFDGMRFSATPLEDFARELQHPCQLIWGAEDRVLHSAGLDILAELLPDAERVLLEKTGHLPMIERPQLCASHYRNFLRNHDFTL